MDRHGGMRMILGRTPAGLIKTESDGGLRAVNCACCDKCYPTPFDPTGSVIISKETGDNIFNRDLTAQMSYNGTAFSMPISKSSPPFSMTRTQTGDDCVSWWGNYGGFPSPDYWIAFATLFRVRGIFYFYYYAGEAEYEPNIQSNPLPPYYVDNFADSSSAKVLGNSVFSLGFCSVPASFGPHISNVTIKFT